LRHCCVGARWVGFRGSLCVSRARGVVSRSSVQGPLFVLYSGCPFVAPWALSVAVHFRFHVLLVFGWVGGGVGRLRRLFFSWLSPLGSRFCFFCPLVWEAARPALERLGLSARPPLSLCFGFVRRVPGFVLVRRTGGHLPSSPCWLSLASSRVELFVFYSVSPLCGRDGVPLWLVRVLRGLLGGWLCWSRCFRSPSSLSSFSLAGGFASGWRAGGRVRFVVCVFRMLYLFCSLVSACFCWFFSHSLACPLAERFLWCVCGGSS